MGTISIRRIAHRDKDSLPTLEPSADKNPARRLRRERLCSLSQWLRGEKPCSLSQWLRGEKPCSLTRWLRGEEPAP